MSWIKRRIAFCRCCGTKDETSDRYRLYRIGIISDYHIGYQYAAEHLSAALNTLHNMGAEEIVTCGDTAVNGTESEWQSYISIINQSPYSRAQIHECNGNHDGAAPDLAMFKQYSNNGALADKKPYFTIAIHGDRYIFMALDAGTSPASGDCFSTAQLDWLETELNKYYDTGINVFLLEHSLFYGWGTGDIISAPRYPRALSLNYATNQRLKSILESHPNLIMLHGHSHIRLEDVSVGLVPYAPPTDAGCHQFHVPAISAGKYLTSSGEPAVDWSMPPECWVCDVYADKIVLTGIRADTGAAIKNMVYTIAR